MSSIKSYIEKIKSNLSKAIGLNRVTTAHEFWFKGCDPLDQESSNCLRYIRQYEREANLVEMLLTDDELDCSFGMAWFEIKTAADMSDIMISVMDYLQTAKIERWHSSRTINTSKS